MVKGPGDARAHGHWIVELNLVARAKVRAGAVAPPSTRRKDRRRARRLPAWLIDLDLVDDGVSRAKRP